MQRLRIAHVIPWGGIGGTERSASELIRFLALRGHSATAFVVGGGRARELLPTSGIDCVDFTPVWPSYRHPWPYWQASAALAVQFKQHRVDIVHCADLPGAYYAVLAARLARVPIVSHVRCEFENIATLDRTILCHVDRFIFPSQAARDAFGYRAGAHFCGSVIHTGFAIDEINRAEAQRALRQEFCIAPDEQVVGMVARVTKIKDYRTLIEGAALLLKRSPRTRFIVVGDYLECPDYYTDVRKWLDECNVADRFLFTGHRFDSMRLLAGMDVCVLCTHSEGFGRVAVEAMLQGVPFVGTRVGGVPELIEHGETGLLHEPQDPSDLAARIGALLTDPDYAKRIALTGQLQARRRFAPDVFTSSMERVYADVLS